MLVIVYILVCIFLIHFEMRTHPQYTFVYIFLKVPNSILHKLMNLESGSKIIRKFLHLMGNRFLVNSQSSNTSLLYMNRGDRDLNTLQSVKIIKILHLEWIIYEWDNILISAHKSFQAHLIFQYHGYAPAVHWAREPVPP